MVDVRRLPIEEDDQTAVTLDDLAREGARRMIATALEAEVADYVERFAEDRDETPSDWLSATVVRGSASGVSPLRWTGVG